MASETAADARVAAEAELASARAQIRRHAEAAKDAERRAEEAEKRATAAEARATEAETSERRLIAMRRRAERAAGFARRRRRARRRVSALTPPPPRPRRDASERTRTPPSDREHLPSDPTGKNVARLVRRATRRRARVGGVDGDGSRVGGGATRALAAAAADVERERARRPSGIRRETRATQSRRGGGVLRRLRRLRRPAAPPRVPPRVPRVCVRVRGGGVCRRGGSRRPRRRGISRGDATRGRGRRAESRETRGSARGTRVGRRAGRPGVEAEISAARDAGRVVVALVDDARRRVAARRRLDARRVVGVGVGDRRDAPTGNPASAVDALARLLGAPDAFFAALPRPRWRRWRRRRATGRALDFAGLAGVVAIRAPRPRTPPPSSTRSRT